jgi:hypothetical protein
VIESYKIGAPHSSLMVITSSCLDGSVLSWDSKVNNLFVLVEGASDLVRQKIHRDLVYQISEQSTLTFIEGSCRLTST